MNHALIGPFTGFRFTAHFTPEAWVRDYAVEIDADGEQEWDCTDFAHQHPGYVLKMFEKVSEHDLEMGVTDNDDLFFDDPAAPEWIREHRGPFTIRISAIRAA